MKTVGSFLSKEKWNLQQVQDYIPLPMTMATAMYVAGTDASGKPLYVAKNAGERERQKRILRPPKVSSNRRPNRNLDTVD